MALPHTVLWNGKKTLIRGLGIGQLCYLVRQWTREISFAGNFRRLNGPLAIEAVATELLTREGVYKTYQSYAKMILSSNCACGNRGLYIHANTTYCDECRPLALNRVRAVKQKRDRAAGWKSDDINRVDAINKKRDSRKKNSTVAQG